MTIQFIIFINILHSFHVQTIVTYNCQQSSLNKKNQKPNSTLKAFSADSIWIFFYIPFILLQPHYNLHHNTHFFLSFYNHHIHPHNLHSQMEIYLKSMQSEMFFHESGWGFFLFIHSSLLFFTCIRKY